MKNERIVGAWSAIEPDGVAEARMLKGIFGRARLGATGESGAVGATGAVGESGATGATKEGKVVRVDTAFNKKRLLPLAACLVLVAVLALAVAVGGNANWFKGEVYTVELGNNATLDFYPGDVGTGSLDFGVDVTSRDLTADENRILLGNLATAIANSYGIFRATDGSLLHVEGHIGATRFVLAAPGVPVSDTIIEADEKVSVVNGVPVSAGYFVTAKDSKGMRNILYFASFVLGDVSVYIERGGPEAESEALRQETVLVIERVIQNGIPDVARITS